MKIKREIYKSTIKGSVVNDQRQKKKQIFFHTPNKHWKNEEHALNKQQLQAVAGGFIEGRPIWATEAVSSNG